MAADVTISMDDGHNHRRGGRQHHLHHHRQQEDDGDLLNVGWTCCRLESRFHPLNLISS